MRDCYYKISDVFYKSSLRLIRAYNFQLQNFTGFIFQEILQ